MSDHDLPSFTSIHYHPDGHPSSATFEKGEIDQDVGHVAFKKMLAELIHRRAAVKEQLDLQVCAHELLFAEEDRDEDSLKEQLKEIIQRDNILMDNLADLKKMNCSLRTSLADELTTLNKEPSIYTASLRTWLAKNDNLIASGEELSRHTTSLRRWLVSLLIAEMLNF